MTVATIQKKMNNYKNVLLSRAIRMSVAVVPRKLYQGPIVGQAYVGGPEMSTEFTFTNFPSFFSPGTASPYDYLLSLYDEEGRLAAKRSVTVPVFGSISIKPKEFFSGTLPAIGLFTAEMRAHGWHTADKHLGKIFPHIFALYYPTGPGGSFGLIHPQTTIGVPPSSGQRWSSGELIDPRQVDRVVVYQINPVREPAETTLQLLDERDMVVAESSVTMPALGTRRIVWPLTPHAARGYLHLGATRLTARNAKPLVFNYFPDGSFSASHS